MYTIQTSQGGRMELAYANAPPGNTPYWCQEYAHGGLSLWPLQGLPQLLSQVHIIFGNSQCDTSSGSSFRTSPSWSTYVLSRFNHVQLFMTLDTVVACQAPLSMEFSMQEFLSGYHALLQGIFLTQRLNLHHLCLQHCQKGSLLLTPPGK